MKYSPILLVLILLCAFSIWSQSDQTRTTPSTQTPPARADEDVVKISTNLVQVDAVVTDNKGQLVTDLRPEEVQIFEDGKSQKISHFSFVSAGPTRIAEPERKPAVTSAAPLPPARLKPEDVRRTIALVVDDLGLSFESTHFVRRALQKFVDQQMQPGDLVAIIRTAGGVGALQQFTSDKRQLQAAISRVRWYPGGRSGIGAFAAIEDNVMMNENTRAASDELNQFREDVFAVGTLGAVNYVVRGMRELPGRKSVLLISDGFRMYSRDDPTRNYRALQSLQQLIDQANRAAVVIYTMDARGLQAVGLTAADSTAEMSAEQIEEQLTNRRNTLFETQEGLTYLARQTGGIPIRNSNDLSGGIRRVLEDQRGYYLIGYRPDESTFDPRSGRRTFHKLSLKVTRPGKFNVRMRNGFYGISDEERPAVANTPRAQIIRALTSPFATAGVHLRLTSLFANDAKLGSYMRSFLHVQGRELKFTEQPDGWQKSMFDVVAVTYGDNGNIVDQMARTYTFKIAPDDYKRMLKDGFVYLLTVPIKKPGAYQLRVALRDHGSEQVGSASQFVEVPDVKKNRLTVSGLLLSSLDAATIRKRTQPSAANGSTESQDEVDNTTSSATRQFHRGQALQYVFIVYNAKLDKVTKQPQVRTQLRLFRDGKLMFTGREVPLSTANQPDLKRLSIGGAFQIGTEMEPGEYVLQLIVTDLLADPKHAVATQWSDFEIVKQ